MAIALSCPGCVQALKVKDELAGRKIKCPKCGAVIPVPMKAAGTDERVMAKAPRSAPVEEDDEPQEERRPKKKKKKKAKSNRVLLIAAAVGGVVLIVVIALVMMLPGDKPKVVPKKPEPVAEQKKQEPAPAPPDEEKKAPVGGLARSREVTKVQNELRQLGIAYRNFETLENRGPKNQQELSSYYENNGEINEALTAQKWLTFIWGAPRQSLTEHGASNTILGYETDADRQGIRMVLLGDGSVRGMDEDEFQKTPKAKGKGK